jgi:hypothetical protein
MKKITLTIVGLFTLLILFCSPAHADTNCSTVTKADIAALFEEWDESLQTGKPSEVTKNYEANHRWVLVRLTPCNSTTSPKAR